MRLDWHGALEGRTEFVVGVGLELARPSDYVTSLTSQTGVSDLYESNWKKLPFLARCLTPQGLKLSEYISEQRS